MSPTLLDHHDVATSGNNSCTHPPPPADAKADASAYSLPPPPPSPSKDPRLVEIATQEALARPRGRSRGEHGIFALTPPQALELLGAGIEVLVAATGDVPPTPPPRSPMLPAMRDMEAEKKSLVRSTSEKNLARLRSGSISSPRPGRSPRKLASAPRPLTPMKPAHDGGFEGVGDGGAETGGRRESIDGVQLRHGPNHHNHQQHHPLSAPKTQQGPQQQASFEPYVVIGANSQPLNLQHSAITRKFYSKQPPPIGIADYLRRIHRFCPMSTAVYLAASLYIHRLAVIEGAIAVTSRNAHRLLLAGLRVAMKALEDASFSHEKMAQVGGVSQVELARLEISFCFLTGFELVVTEAMLEEHWGVLRDETEA
ncbi:hypothetical protein P8C59_000696 [Phyllachora maydis]|uniref:Uncharacterized protein n=1 Tax=Phyllachora maydis TaxID=1825666 RepID=A0AAD9MAN3_9PEZI|nr:hypothetical protein P8C59_000696 [Phyllachora maydis]